VQGLQGSLIHKILTMQESLLIEKLAAIEQMLANHNTLLKDVFTLEEACHYLSFSQSYMYKLTSTKQIPYYVPTGKKIFFKREELDLWLLQNRQSTNAEIQQEAANYINRKSKW
jgi:excisionase family DNA binding protein